MLYKLSRSLHQLRHNSQKGFTLIEMLVVISILGILAAVVTISMIGVTSTAQQNANKTELKTVQVALDSLLTGPSAPADAPTAGCQDNAGNQSTDMTIWPDTVNKTYVLDPPIPPIYIHEHFTHIKVWCDKQGRVHSPDVPNS